MTLLLVVLLTSSAQVPESGRSARLLGMSTADQVRLELSHLKHDRPFTALRVTGVVTFALGAAVPTYLLVAGLVGGGIGLWFSPATVGASLGTFFSGLFVAIPPIAWIAMAAVALTGIALTVASFVLDAPRQAEVRRLKQLERTLRRYPPAEVGPVLLTF